MLLTVNVMLHTQGLSLDKHLLLGAAAFAQLVISNLQLAIAVARHVHHILTLTNITNPQMRMIQAH
jgi:hypothetical protein